ncbi:MAG TPA: DUF4917 family protein [Bacteroidia bacterium]|jgi:hypothetical protein|nr:DUF4917 family protein [Bacteroidia bacterium]
MELISFETALNSAINYSKKHLLLGNGFSIACINKVFSYNSLFDETDFTAFPEIKKSFEQLKTTDFELVIEALEKAALIIPGYTEELPQTIIKIAKDAIRIKELLIGTLANRHPELPSDVPAEKYIACRKFISHFIANDVNDGRIYSLNYDLLLYWTLMHDVENESYTLNFNDGFGRDINNENGETSISDYLIWQGKTELQNIYYLHGALHLVDSGQALMKFSWKDTGKKLIDQCRNALNENKFPLFVTEGDYQKKLEKITHNAYLYTSFESFENVMLAGKSKTPGNTCLFTYGVSFSNNDEHVFEAIASGRIKHLYIGIFGELRSDANKEIIAKVESLKRRRTKFPLEITYYCSSSAKVWG